MRTSGGEQKECSRYLWKDLSQVQEQKRYVANLAVLGTVDMLEMSQDRQCADERTRTQAGADLDRDTRCPPATTRRHTTRLASC